MPLAAADAASETLRTEASLLARYLSGRDPGAEIADRYARACRALFVEEHSARDAALMGFALRHPWSLPCLDAACGLVDPQSLLRRKLILMLALLETTPDHVDLFLARPRPRASVIARLMVWGAASLLKAGAGLLLLPLARRRA
jgi:hypothetical protein